jgi:hypothetical protein
LIDWPKGKKSISVRQAKRDKLEGRKKKKYHRERLIFFLSKVYSKKISTKIDLKKG